MANVLIVAYDLHEKPEENYERLIAAITSYRSTFEFQRSVWIVGTERTRSEVRDYLNRYIESDDKLFVGDLTGASWTAGQSGLVSFLRQYWSIG